MNTSAVAPGRHPGRHLDEHELVDAFDGTLSDDRRAHSAACPACATRIEKMQAVASRALAADVPEPPAFFWNQLSARVRAAVAEETPAGSRFSEWRQWTRPALAAAAVLAIALLTLLPGLRRDRSVEPPSPAIASASPEIVDPPEDVFADIDNDEAWALVRTLAEDLDHDEMDGEGVSARPGAIDRLSLELSARERTELARLIQEQLKGRTIPESVS
jgi:hypothetical protein